MARPLGSHRRGYFRYSVLFIDPCIRASLFTPKLPRHLPRTSDDNQYHFQSAKLHALDTSNSGDSHLLDIMEAPVLANRWNSFRNDNRARYFGVGRALRN
jgi:hypothetical protein